ncbi:MAG: glycosyltransferase [Veillonellales bacterium]
MIPAISLAMIVRNEAKYLLACLDSVCRLVNEIVIVDTGSTDRTVEIAKQFSDKIFSFPWKGDFSAARNYALDHCTGDWILSLDADEQFAENSGDLHGVIIQHPEYEAFFLPLHNQRTPLDGDYDRCAVLRLFRNTPSYRYFGMIHEQVMLAKPEAVGAAPGPVIIHQLVLPRERNSKRGRNLVLLKKVLADQPGNCFLQYYLGVEWLGLGQFSKALPYFQQTRRRLPEDHLLFRAPAVRHTITCLSALNRWQDACCVCREETRRYPAYTDLFFDYGVLLLITGDYRASLECFQKALDSGCPPAVFSHTNGTDSFLALYHAGECHEKLGQSQNAQILYQQALAANPDFVYPLCSLFFLGLAAEGASRSFNRFRSVGCLENKQWRSILALLFFISGYAELALSCLEGDEYLPEGDSDLSLVRCLVYCGRGEQALAALNKLKKAAMELSVAGHTYQVIAQLFAGHYREAKDTALSLWRQADNRSAAWALLSLISRCHSGKLYRGVEKSRETEAARVLLDIAADCLRAGSGRDGAMFRRLAAEALDLVSGMSPAGARLTAEFWRKQGKDVEELMNIQYLPARSLYV